MADPIDVRSRSLHPAHRPPEVHALIDSARRHALGLDFLLRGAHDAVAAGVGWMLCADTVLDRRTDRRLRRSDRHSFLPVVLVPLGGLALLVRAGWLLLHT